MLRKIAIALIVTLIAGATGAREGQSQDRPGPQQEFLDPVEAVPEWLQFQVAGALPKEGLSVWVPGGSFRQSALVRVPRFPKEKIEPLDTTQARPLRLAGVQNEQLSAQLAVASTEPLTELRAEVSTFRGEGGATWPADAVRVRYVRFLPVVRALIGIEPAEVAGRGVSGTGAPDVVGDALVERARVSVPRLRAQPIWFTFKIPKSLPPGAYTGAITLRADGHNPVRREVTVNVRDYALPDPADYAFHLNIWMSANAVAKQHGVEAWSEAHWALLEAYMSDWASRGQKVINTIITEQPWLVEWPDGQWRPQSDAGYESMVKWSYDGGAWDFDYTIFDRYVATAFRQGVGPWISAWSLLAFRGEQRLTYYDAQRGEQVVEKVALGSERWREVWAVFLEDFADHLREKGWLEQTFLGADERPAELMKEIAALVRSAAPAFADQIQSSGSAEAAPYASSELDLYYLDLPGQEHAPADMEAFLRQRREEKELTTFYIACCGPEHPNTFTYSPAVESLMLPWIAAKDRLDGFSRWAYNSWPPDVYAAPAFRYPQGDEYLVYPGEDGPVSSIRWELLREGIEDYELVRAARRAQGEESSDIERALTRATRNPDGRNKEQSDLPEARDTILDVLVE